MRWPLVSRLAYEVVIDERDRLRVRNDSLVDSLERLARASAGLREVPPPKAPLKQAVEIPAELRPLIDGWAGEVSRASMERQVRAMLRAGQTPAEIRAKMEALT